MPEKIPEKKTVAETRETALYKVPSNEQDELARELSGLPLRGDVVRQRLPDGRIIEGTIEDYYTVEGKKYATLVDAQGGLHGMFLESLSPEAQAELHHDQVVEEVGETALDASELEDPKDSSYFSEESARLRDEAVRGTREHPKLLDIEEDVLVSKAFRDASGDEHRGHIIGSFVENGQNFKLLSVPDRYKEAGFEGEYLAVPAEHLYNPTVQVETSIEDAQMISSDERVRLRQAAQRVTGVSESATSQQELSTPSIEDQLKELTTGLSQDDLLNLRSYAWAKQDKAEAQKQNNGQASIEAGQKMGQSLRAMSEKAQSLLNQYVYLFNRLP